VVASASTTTARAHRALMTLRNMAPSLVGRGCSIVSLPPCDSDDESGVSPA
jgi:hypothetical protein